MISKLFCKIFVDSELDKSELARRVATSTGGQLDLWSVRTEWSIVDVLKNGEHDPVKKDRHDDGFLFFPYIVETDPCSGVPRSDYVRKVGELIAFLRVSGCKVVPACDFESELPST